MLHLGGNLIRPGSLLSWLLGQIMCNYKSLNNEFLPHRHLSRLYLYKIDS